MSRELKPSELSEQIEILVPVLAKAIVQQLYADEWIDVHQAAALVKLSRSRLDELKSLGRFPRADRWVAGKQVWNRLTIEQWKKRLDAEEQSAEVPQDDKTWLRMGQLRRQRGT